MPALEGSPQQTGSATLVKAEAESWRMSPYLCHLLTSLALQAVVVAHRHVALWHRSSLYGDPAGDSAKGLEG